MDVITLILVIFVLVYRKEKINLISNVGY